jgi:hypothetical protein
VPRNQHISRSDVKWTECNRVTVSSTQSGSHSWKLSFPCWESNLNFCFPILNLDFIPTRLILYIGTFCVLIIHGALVESSPILLLSYIGPLYQLWMMDEGDDCGAICRINKLSCKRKYFERICPSAVLSITNPTCLEPGSNPGHRGGKPGLTVWVMVWLFQIRLAVNRNVKFAASMGLRFHTSDGRKQAFVCDRQFSVL